MDNKWLQDHQFLDSIDFPDKTYLKEVASTIRVYAFKCPLKYVQFNWNASNKAIDVYLRDKKVGEISVDVDVAPHDVVTLIERDLYKYFPQYNITSDEMVTVEYTADEIAELIRKDPSFDIDEVFNLGKTVNKSECGVIERVWILDDKFKFVRTINGKRQEELRISTIPLSEFLGMARKLKQEALQEHIELKSMLLSIYTPRPVEVAYTGDQLENFIKINSNEGFIYPLQSTSAGMLYKYGRYVFLLSEEDKERIMPLIEHKIRRSVIDLGSD